MIGYMGSGATLFKVMNALLSLAKKRQINECCDSTTKMNNEKSTLFLIQKMQKYQFWFGRQYGVVIIQKSTELKEDKEFAQQ